jgi:hypothetical protein
MTLPSKKYVRGMYIEVGVTTNIEGHPQSPTLYIGNARYNTENSVERVREELEELRKRYNLKEVV